MSKDKFMLYDETSNLPVDELTSDEFPFLHPAKSGTLAGYPEVYYLL